MKHIHVPDLPVEEISVGIKQAIESDRKRFAKILHQSGAEFNQVFNFINHASYMQPHLHPGDEKIEYIHVVDGRLAILFFNDAGVIIDCTVLEKSGVSSIAVPAFTWHTYVMLSENVITYETMMGVYQPGTWKRFASWAPPEGGTESAEYLASLRREALSMGT
jgi:cupin fold WbuC family metalloprotein